MFYTLIISKKQKIIAAVLLLALAGGLGLHALRGGVSYCTNEDLAGGASDGVAAELPAVSPAPDAAPDGAQKVAYLTFDDGPSKTTEQVLDTLKEFGVPATFFVCTAENNEKYLPLLSRTAAEGHQIALHSNSHRYRTIYSSTGGFWEDLEAEKEKLKPYVGDQQLNCLRFPGGSTNTVSHKYGGSGIMKALKKQAAERGYRYFDWNVCAYDAVGGHPSASTILGHVLKEAKGHDRIIVLMHDTGATKTTAEALPDIIRELSSMGYVFDTVQNYPLPTPEPSPTPSASPEAAEAPTAP